MSLFFLAWRGQKHNAPPSADAAEAASLERLRPRVRAKMTDAEIANPIELAAAWLAAQR